MTPDLEFNKNEDQFKQLVHQLQTKSKKVKQGGGEKKIAEQHQKGKLTRHRLRATSPGAAVVTEGLAGCNARGPRAAPRKLGQDALREDQSHAHDGPRRSAHHEVAFPS